MGVLQVSPEDYDSRNRILEIVMTGRSGAICLVLCDQNQHQTDMLNEEKKQEVLKELRRHQDLKDELKREEARYMRLEQMNKALECREAEDILKNYSPASFAKKDD